MAFRSAIISAFSRVHPINGKLFEKFGDVKDVNTVAIDLRTTEEQKKQFRKKKQLNL
jgi:hypothetical protein